MTQHFNRTADRAKRRALRRNATEPERKLWQHLRNQQCGVKFRRQYSVDSYVLDFYAPGCTLAIEIDGNSHFTPEVLAYDHERSMHLQGFGIAVLRFTNTDVLENVGEVIERIDNAVKQRSRTSPGPSLPRRGNEAPPW